jgi:hypothetical protein
MSYESKLWIKKIKPQNPKTLRFLSTRKCGTDRHYFVDL